MSRPLPSFAALVGLLFALALLLAPAPARADAARDAFNEGKMLFGKSDFAGACKAFEKSEKLGGENVNSRFWLGRCNEMNKRPAAAYRYFEDALQLAEKAGDNDRVDAIKDRLRELEGKVGFLVVTVPPKVRVDGLEIRCDGETVHSDDWGMPRAVEIGEHKILVVAPAKKSITLTVTTTDPGAKAQIVIPELPAGDGTAPAPTPGPSPDPAPGPRPGPQPPAPLPGDPGAEMERRNPALFWTGVGLVISSGVAAIAGVAVLIQGGVGEDGVDHFPAVVASFVGTAVFLGVGIPFMAVFGKRVPAEPEEKASIHIEPVLTPGGLGLIGTF
jgi:hypothetical protein